MEGGDWTLIVENIVTGCTETSVATVLADEDLPQFQFTSVDSPCFGDNGGQILIHNIIGGTPPFTFQLNGGDLGEVLMTDELGMLTDTLSWGNLGPGNYTITMLDDLTCETSATTIIAEPGPITFDVGSDLTVEVGETVILGVNNIDSENIASVTWTQDGEEICQGTPGNCLDIEVEPPLIPTEYCLEVVTEAGCLHVECRTLQSLAVRDIYFPNIISGWDGETEPNTTFYVHTDEFVTSIPSFAIFDRWGELIFSYEDGFPNDPAWGWDGSFNGDSAAQGVYVYLIELGYAGGETEIFTGTVTVTR